MNVGIFRCGWSAAGEKGGTYFQGYLQQTHTNEIRCNAAAIGFPLVLQKFYPNTVVR
jgi:hypothetical protein